MAVSPAPDFYDFTTTYESTTSLSFIYYFDNPQDDEWCGDAIINGEEEHATSMHYIEDGIDCGDIIDQKKFPLLETDTGKIAYDRGTRVTFEMFCENLKDIENGTVKRIKQNENDATYYKKELPNDGYVDWNKTRAELLKMKNRCHYSPLMRIDI